MSFNLDLFSINNIVIPTRDKKLSSNYSNKKQTLVTSSNFTILEQKKFECIDVISIDPKKIDALHNKELQEIHKKFRKNKNDQKYRKGNSFKNLKVSKWHSFLFERMKASIRSRNNATKRIYNKELEKHKMYIANGFPSEEPTMRRLYDLPNFTAEFLIKLWEIQNGLDAYTNKPMIISDKLNSFSVSCDRIDSNINYEIGNVVLCCYSTNLGKHEFDPFSDEDSNWMDYIADNDPIKKEEIRQRIRRIQTLSME